MLQLSWDLHLHPGPSAVPRWGDGLQVWQAARDAGVRGFVWKSHEEHTAERVRALPPGPPMVIGSASLNPWATVDSVVQAIGAGARWIWAPTRDARADLGWNLPLPSWWPQLKPELARLPGPVVLATGHVDAAGRRELARTAAGLTGVPCSVTHSLYLAADEAAALAELGCAFEFDLYTSTFHVPGRPEGDLLARAESLRDKGCFAYLTSDAGQAQVGNPFKFSSRVLVDLARHGRDGLVDELAVRNPAEFVGRVLPAEVRS